MGENNRIVDTFGNQLVDVPLSLLEGRRYKSLLDLSLGNEDTQDVFVVDLHHQLPSLSATNLEFRKYGLAES